ncbi:hypothetical protein AVEN_85895-1 [Araneus ventricosus]|uniref:Uncharacterized protein n=1 Tax=Araneus ventricosus TaxID=182803 RepID=A0A4Y2LUT6_ARAVE|nr:hypothetical protein AVEN_85895-1 [Araneus ventricosus]
MHSLVNLKETRPGISHPGRTAVTTAPALDGGKGAPGATLISNRNISSEGTLRPGQDQTPADTCWSRGHEHHSNHQPRSKSTHTPP